MATGSFLTDQGCIDLSLEAGEDLSGKQYYAVKRDATTGKAVLAGANEKCLGILQNKPTAGQTAQVRTAGISNALIDEGGTILFGKFLTPTSAGKLEICDGAGEEFIAKLLTVGTVTADLCEVLVIHGEVEATDA